MFWKDYLEKEVEVVVSSKKVFEKISLSENKTRLEVADKIANVGPSEKLQLMPYAAIYEKGFLHGREATEEPIYCDMKEVDCGWI